MPLGISDWLDKGKKIISSLTNGGDKESLDLEGIGASLAELPTSVSAEQLQSFIQWIGKFLTSRHADAVPGEAKEALSQQVDIAKAQPGTAGWQGLRSFLTDKNRIAQIALPLLTFARENKGSLPDWIAKAIS
ncbi:MAG: hypothetical protein LBS72_08855 [Oscillospiraceae bacterium]|jgi:hypothetical protein|nr:hypothetical protein [Oscillospiraceae bacterium]